MIHHPVGGATDGAQEDPPVNRNAITHYPIHPLLAARWSPRAFAPRPVERETLGALLEAARWAASCFNEQPWRFIIATREDAVAHARLLACLTEGNRSWAHLAPVLGLGIASTTFTHNGKPNRHAWHDLGLATAQLTVEAMARGLYVHPMAGILPEVARETYGIPPGYDVATGLAIGYLGDPTMLPPAKRDAETAPRVRRPLSGTVFSGAWEMAAGL